jgi:ESCRT-I complex subunit VPS28
MRSKAELHPLLSEVIQSANAATGGREFDGKASIVKWLIRLNGMRVQDCLGEEEGGELAFELAAAYEGFKGSLG